MKKIVLQHALSFTSRSLIFCLLLVGLSMQLNAQNVTIPNTIFKTALLSNNSINTNSDGEIQTSEAAAYTGTIDVSGLGITNLTGIEAFTAITVLDCSFNLLTSLDVLANTALVTLKCQSNSLTSLEIY